jgi:hypothetical protein
MRITMSTAWLPSLRSPYDPVILRGWRNRFRIASSRAQREHGGPHPASAHPIKLHLTYQRADNVKSENKAHIFSFIVGD